jgi:cell division transport system ATP-binding protein
VILSIQTPGWVYFLLQNKLFEDIINYIEQDAESLFLETLTSVLSSEAGQTKTFTQARIMEKSTPLIEIKNLSRWYRDNPVPLFDKLSFSLQPNDFFVLTGKSGTGKTTLVKFITGKLTPPEKTIFYNRQDISLFTWEDIQILRKRLGIIFQDYQLLEDLSVRENIIYPLHLYELGEIIIDSKLRQVLQKVNVKHLLDKPVKLLSSWEKQRVALARALIHDPEFIIADEPTGNLDRENTEAVANILIAANKAGNTIFLITHDIHLLNYLKAKHPIKLHVIK